MCSCPPSLGRTESAHHLLLRMFTLLAHWVQPQRPAPPPPTVTVHNHATGEVTIHDPSRIPTSDVSTGTNTSPVNDNQIIVIPREPVARVPTDEPSNAEESQRLAAILADPAVRSELGMHVWMRACAPR